MPFSLLIGLIACSALAITAGVWAYVREGREAEWARKRLNLRAWIATHHYDGPDRVVRRYAKYRDSDNMGKDVY